MANNEYFDFALLTNGPKSVLLAGESRWNFVMWNECSHTLKSKPNKIFFQPDFALKTVSISSEMSYDCVERIKLGLGWVKTHFFHKMLKLRKYESVHSPWAGTANRGKSDFVTSSLGKYSVKSKQLNVQNVVQNSCNFFVKLFLSLGVMRFS